MAIVQYRAASLQAAASHPALHTKSSSYTQSLHRLRVWAASGSSAYQTVEDISLEEAEALNSKLAEEGIKVRYDWCEETRTASFKMPTIFHELVASWLARNEDRINSHIRDRSLCKGYSVVWGGSASVPLGNNPYLPQPDGSFYLQYKHPKAPQLQNLGYSPRVVLETAYTQHLDKALNKACLYLHQSPDKHTHAVIVCKLLDIGSKPELKFQAWISVWVRVPVHDPTSDFPMDPCRHQDSWGPHPNVTAEPVLSDDASSSHHSANSSAMITHQYTEKSKKKMCIWNRSGWLLFAKELPSENSAENTYGSKVDHEQEAVIQSMELELNIYDFVRVCNRYPSSYIPRDQQEITLNLEWLREQLLAALPVMRCTLPAEDRSNMNAPRSYPGDSSLTRIFKRFFKLEGRARDEKDAKRVKNVKSREGKGE